MQLVPDREVQGAFIVRVEGTDQSFVDPADPTRLEFDYVQRLADVLDTCAPAGQRLRVIHIGGAGMTLPRYVAATRPSSAQIVLEPNAKLTAAVREAMPLPRHSGIKVRPLDGRTGIAACPDDYADVIILDAFGGAQVPAELTTAEFLADLGRVLADGGVLLANITDRAPFGYARRVVAGIAERWCPVVVAVEPSTLKGRRFGNLVISAGAGVDPTSLTRSAARSPFPYRVMSGGVLAGWLRGARPFTDSDAEQSPPPPDGPLTFR